jgi:hypothetical protein
MLVYQRVQETPNLKAWTRSCSVAELREASAMTSNIEDGKQVLLTPVFLWILTVLTGNAHLESR